MELGFDIRGNLQPYQKNKTSLEKVEELFVINFPKSETRIDIFKNFEQYLTDFQAEISNNFEVWINGSFVSNKLNPKDIDFVILLDYISINQKKELLEKKFLNKSSTETYNLDAYVVNIYPKEHKNYSFTVSDLLYWEHFFTKTRLNRAKKRFSKGFITLSF